MKRAIILLAPLLAFVLGAVVAWISGSPGQKAFSAHENAHRSPRQREANLVNSRGPAVIAAQFEKEMLVYRSPPKEIHDADGMEAVLKFHRKTQGRSTSGIEWFSYSTKWAEESPVEMFTWLIREGGSDFKERGSAASVLFEKWATKDMEAALAAVARISDTSLRRQALASSLEVLCQSNPTRARDLLMQNLDLFPPDLECSVFKPYGTGKTTCELLLALSPGPERTRLLVDFLTSVARWSGEEAVNAISAWNDVPESMRREWVAAGFSSGKETATAFDGLEEMTRELVETTGNPRSADQFMEAHGPAWAKRDLRGALDWAQAHLKGKSLFNQSLELFAAAARGNPDAAMQRWQLLPQGFLKSQVAKAIVDNAPADRRADVISVMRPSPSQ